MAAKLTPNEEALIRSRNSPAPLLVRRASTPTTNTQPLITQFVGNKPGGLVPANAVPFDGVTPTAAEKPPVKQVRNNGTSNAQQTPKPFDFSTAPKPSNKELEPSNADKVNKENRVETTGISISETFSINSFRSEIINNDVLPSHSYLVTFSPFRAGYSENKLLTDFVVTKRNTLMMRCESIILPTPSLLEEENIRRYGYGPVEKVPYGVQFSDVSMTWLVDSKSEIIDFMHQWMNTIVMHDAPNANMSQTPSSEKRPGLEGYRPFEVGYKDGYTNPIVRVYVYNRQLQTVTEYEMYDVFPMNIQSMNLAWADENQIQKLTVNFAYTNMRVKAPRKTTEAQANFLRHSMIYYEGVGNPYEERTQPSDKGGAAAADKARSPLGEVLTVTTNASSPNATEPQEPSVTAGLGEIPVPQSHILGG
jgi:hypothetical protein